MLLSTSPLGCKGKHKYAYDDSKLLEFQLVTKTSSHEHVITLKRLALGPGTAPG